MCTCLKIVIGFSTVASAVCVMQAGKTLYTDTLSAGYEIWELMQCNTNGFAFTAGLCYSVTGILENVVLEFYASSSGLIVDDRQLIHVFNDYKKHVKILIL